VVLLYVWWMVSTSAKQGEELAIDLEVTFGRMGMRLATEDAIKMCRMGNVVDVRRDDIIHGFAAITVQIVALGIKMTLVLAAVEVVVPIGVVGDGAIQDSGIPSDIRGERYVW
jgi:hypothetical protein